MPSRFPRPFALAIIGLLLTGCASSRLHETDFSANDASSWTAQYVEQALRVAAKAWDDVPYRWGGTSRRGIDCSGLVQAIYRNVFATMLPRTTTEQFRVGTPVDPSSLRPGDLLFFRPQRGRWHSGIYVSQGQFIHASTSEGVTISRLTDAYWQRRWSQARRVIAARKSTSSSRRLADETSTTW